MKVPCGGFDLDESVFNVDKNLKQVKLNSPISYDYMPEGYPKKDGWSIEWDGNTVGKIAAVGASLYKISDMMPTYDDLWSATLTPIDLPGDPAAVSDLGMTETKDSDNITTFIIGGKYFLLVITENNASVEGVTFPKKGTYAIQGPSHFKLSVGSGVITPMSSDFMPKNLNVVISVDTSGDTNVYSCNVTYDELRGWVDRCIPVLVTIYEVDMDTNNVRTITSIREFSNYLELTYINTSVNKKQILYNSDGSIVPTEATPE